MSATSANTSPHQRPNTHIDSQSIADLADGAGRVAWSKAAGRYMPPTNARRIDPNSPEGKAITTRLLRSMT